MRYWQLFENLTPAMVRRHIRQLGKSDEMSFDVIHHDASRHSPERPLVVLIHPGDMIEDPRGWERNDYRSVGHFSKANQRGTALDLQTWRKAGADAVVLHRSSCEQFDKGYGKEEDFKLEIKTTWKTGSVVFGDDLEKAVAWMVQNLHIADRPHIYMAGAYADPETGCLSYVADQFEAIVGSDRITVSDYAYPGNAPGKVWRPNKQHVEYPTDVGYPPRQAVVVALSPKGKVIAQMPWNNRDYSPEHVAPKNWREGFKWTLEQYILPAALKNQTVLMKDEHGNDINPEYHYDYVRHRRIERSPEDISRLKAETIKHTKAINRATLAMKAALEQPGTVLEMRPMA